MNLLNRYEKPATLAENTVASLAPRVEKVVLFATQSGRLAEIAGWNVHTAYKLIERAKFSARSWWDMCFFDYDRRLAIKRGVPSEGINAEAGVHSEAFRIVKGIDVKTAKEMTTKALIVADINNTKLLNRVFLATSKDGEKAFFVRHRDRKKSTSWLRTVAETRDPATNKGVKDWNVWFNNTKGRPEPRNAKETVIDLDLAENKAHAKFEIAVVPLKQLNEDLDVAGVVENMPVARILLGRDFFGRIKGVRVLTPHYTANEPQEREIVKSIIYEFKKVGIEVNPIINEGSFIWRSKRISRFFEKYTMFDVSTQVRVPESLIRLFFLAQNSFKTRMPLTAFIVQPWLSLHGGDSAYDCVDPDKAIRKDLMPPSALQLALIPSMAEFKTLKILLEQVKLIADPSEKLNEIVELIRNNFDKTKTYKYLQDFNNFVSEEISESRRGQGLIAILGAYLPDGLKNIFSATQKKAKAVISDGEFQVSIADLSKDAIEGVEFTTAMAASTSDVLGITRHKSGYVFNLRQRTGKNVYKRAVAEAKKLRKLQLKSDFHEDIRMIVKKQSREQMNNYLAASAVYSFIVAAINITAENKPDNLEKYQKLKQVAREVFSDSEMIEVFKRS